MQVVGTATKQAACQLCDIPPFALMRVNLMTNAARYDRPHETFRDRQQSPLLSSPSAEYDLVALPLARGEDWDQIELKSACRVALDVVEAFWHHRVSGTLKD